jgi:GNAT superfamily N-acetyltransferase
MVRVARVSAEVTYPLRQRVLRPHQTVTTVGFPGDDDPRTGTYAALTADGEIVGTATVHPEPCPWRPSEDTAWRLRAMATTPETRGHGVGAAVLAAAMAHVAEAGGTLVWCTARTPVQGFYERAGFHPHGEPWEEPMIGPHIRMWRAVASGSATP